MAEWDAMVEAMRHRPLEIEFRKSQVLTEEALEKLRAAQLAYTQKKLQEHQFMMQQMAMQAHETAMQQQQLYMQELHRAHLREELSGHVCRACTKIPCTEPAAVWQASPSRRACKIACQGIWPRTMS